MSKECKDCSRISEKGSFFSLTFREGKLNGHPPEIFFRISNTREIRFIFDEALSI